MLDTEYSTTSSSKTTTSDTPELTLQHILEQSSITVEIPPHHPLLLVLYFEPNGNYTAVKKILPEQDDQPTFQNFDDISIGYILISINEHSTLSDDISDVLDFLEMLKDSGLSRTLRFISPIVLLDNNRVKIKTQNKDFFGFFRDLDYLLGERVYNNANLSLIEQRDLEWIAFLKHIGGADNLKPVGVFEPSVIIILL